MLADKVNQLRRPDEAEWPAWSGFVRTAWDELRDDRHVGDMGGLGRIYFTAIDQYCQRHCIAGNEFDDFLIFIRALDDEFLRHVGEKRKAEQAKKEKR